MIMWPTNSKGLEGVWLLVSPSNWTKEVYLQIRGTYKLVEIPQLMGNFILFQESCVVALDMYKYEQSNEFQYADSLVKLQEKWQAVAMTTWTYSTEECKLLDDISEIGHLYMRVPKTLTFKTRLCAKPFIWKRVLCASNNFFLKKDYHNNGFTFNLTLKQNLGVTCTRNGLLANGMAVLS